MHETHFAANLNRTLDYIRGYAVSFVLQSLIADGALAAMKTPFTIDRLAEQHSYRPDLFGPVIKFLVVEEIVAPGKETGSYQLTDYGTWVADHPGWIELLVGGYHPVYSGLSDILKHGPEAAQRDAHFVGLGSYEISLYDAFPLAWKLIDRVNRDAKRFVDVGCGDGYFVREICNRMPHASAIGIEPSESWTSAAAAVERAGLADRIEIHNLDALNYAVEPDTDFLLFAFVLQEMLPSIGEEGLVTYFQRLRDAGFAGSVLAIEVEYDLDNLELLRTPIGRGYYNPYYLIHPLTSQRLMPIARWKALFERAGYRLVAEDTVDPQVDPSGLEVGLVFTPR